MKAILEIAEFWQTGGWLMVPLFLLALLLYISAFRLLLHLRTMNYALTRIPAHRLISSAGNDLHSLRQLQRQLAFMQESNLNLIDRRIRFVATLITVAPLAGLLGTVSGMLKTFTGLALSGMGRTIDIVAGGVSEALITTQTGLLIAIPAYLLLSMIRRQRNHWLAALAGIESTMLRTIALYARKEAA